MDHSEHQQDQRCSHCGTALTGETTGGLCPRCLLEMNFASRTMPGGEDSPRWPPPSPEEIAARFPQFEILECLGRGGMGIVYKARQKTLDRLVAIKVLAGERRDDPLFEARFSREARTLAKLSHPNIVTVHDFGQSDGMFYLVMEFVDGVNLRDVLRDGRMEPAQALAIVPSICEALQFAHDHGVVHRDIKPENILMDRDGRVKIADFGIATLVGANAERSGTPPYMAPEQEAAEGTIDHRADIYALGVVFYEMLTGERPKQDPSRPSQRVEVDVRLDEIVLRALRKEPEQRYQTAGEFRTVVQTIAAPAGAPGVELPPVAEEGKTPGVNSTGNPRFPRLAIWGAVWASFFFIFSAVKWFVTGSADQHAGPDLWAVLLTAPLALLGLAAPFGTTILGWVSVSQIRRSAGRLYGLGLAVFDGLFFPLLVLDGVIFWAGSELVEVLARLGVDEGPGAASPQFGATGPLVLLILIVDFLIVRAVWRAVNKPLEGRGAMPPRPPESDTAGPPDRSSGTAGRTKGGRAALGGIIIMGLGGLVALGAVANFHFMFGVEKSSMVLAGVILVGFGALAAVRGGNTTRSPAGTSASQSAAPFRSPTDRNDRNGWELTTILAGTLFFVLFSVFAWNDGPLRVPLLAISALGLAICALSLAGLWPFPSPIFPEPNFSSRNLRRRWLLVSFFGVVALAVVLTALLFWLQRPRRVDEPNISATSPDGMYDAIGQTWHVMRIFGADRTFYRFRIQGRAGAVWEKWDVDVPYDHLATSYVLLSRDEILFGKHGRIVWSEDGKRASFRVNGLEVSAYNTVDGSHSFQGGYLPQREAVFPADSEFGTSFLDLDMGHAVTLSEQSVQALAANVENPQMSPEICEWMRATGADLRMHVGVSGLRLLDGASISVCEKSDPRVGGRAFDIISAEQVVEASDAVEEAFAGSPVQEPPLFLLNCNQVYAVKSREGAVALVEVLDESEFGPTRIRYKLVEPDITATSGAQTGNAEEPNEAQDPADDLPAEAEGEQAARERVARGFFKAMLRGDVEGTRALLAPRSPLPHVVDLEEWVAEAPSALQEEYGGEAWRLTTFVEWLSDGDWAVARTTSMPEDSKRGLYVVLQRGNQGWGVVHVETAKIGVPLRHYLERVQPFAEASVETAATGTPGATPEGTLQDYTEAALSGDREKALSFLAPPLSEAREEIGKGILLGQVRRQEGAEPMAIVEWHKEGVYAVARYRSPPEAIQAEMPFKPYVILERVGPAWKVVWSSVFRNEGSLANELKIFRKFRLVDRGDPKGVARAFIGAVRKGDSDMAMMLSGFPMSGNPGELAREFARADREAPGAEPVVPSGWHEEGDYAVTRAKLLADRPELETCLVLKRTGRIWQVVWADASGPEASLADDLERFKKEIMVGRVMVEDLALRFLVAIREKDEKTLRELCVDRTEGWTEALLGQFSMELRERFRQMTGEEFALYPGTLQIDRKRKEKDLAVVRCLAEREVQGKLEGNILVLHFCRTGDGWKVWTARKAPESQTLDEHLAQAREWAAEWEDAPPAAGGSGEAQNTPEQVAHAFMDALRTGSIDVAMECMSPEMKAMEGIRKVMERASGELVKTYAKELDRLTEFTEWYPEKRDADTRFIGTRIAGTSGKNVRGMKGGLYLILAPTPEGWKLAHLDDVHSDKPLSYYVDRIVRIIPGEGPEIRGASAEVPEMAPDQVDRVVRNVLLPDASTFGSVVEVTLASRSKGGLGSFLDLETGRQMTPPKMGSITEQRTWERKNGSDGTIWLHQVEDIVVDAAFTGLDVLATSARDSSWKTMTPAELKEQLDREIKIRNLGLPCLTKMKQRDGSHGTIVWLIKTREGSYGMLQIVDFTDKPPGVKLRYKLVQEEKALVPGTDRDLLSKAKALPVTPPTTGPDGSPLTVEQVKKVLEDVTWGEFIVAFADDGHEDEVAWKGMASDGGNGIRFEVTFPFGGEKMVLDLEADPEFQRLTPSGLRPAKRPDQIMADPAEFLPQMAIRYAVQSDHPAAAPAVEKGMERARQARDLSTMRQYAVAIAVCQQDTNALPPTLQLLVEKKYLRELMPMMNHETGKMEPPLYHGRPDLQVKDLDVKTIIFASPSADRSGKRVVGFLDSSVKVIDEADYHAQLKVQADLLQALETSPRNGSD